MGMKPALDRSCDGLKAPCSTNILKRVIHKLLEIMTSYNEIELKNKLNALSFKKFVI